MWRAISLFWLFAVLLGLSCVDFALGQTVPSNRSGFSPGWPSNTGNPLLPDEMLAFCNSQYSNFGSCSFSSSVTEWAVNKPSDPRSAGVFGGGALGAVCPDSTWSLSSDLKTCSKPDPDEGSFCSGAQLANFCSMNAGQAVDTSPWNVGTRARICDNVHPKIPGCNIQQNTGCRITRNYPQVTQFKYNGEACAQVPDGDPNNQNGTSPSSCAPGEYYGTVNNVTGCFGGGPVPPSDKPSTDPATGKDANGNCAAGYVGRIKNNALECIPAHEPSDGKSCPSGWNAVGVGGKTVCVDPTSGPGGGSGGTGGNTGGGTGGNTGGNTGGGTGGTPGKPDASSPSGGKPGENPGDKPGECDYTGMWKFLCSDKPGAPDTSSPNLVNEGGVNLTSLLNTNDIFTRPAACPANLRIDLGEGSVELQYTLLCSFAEKVRPGVIIVCVVVAAFIIFRRG